MQCVYDVRPHFCILLQGDLWLRLYFDEQFHECYTESGWKIFGSAYTMQETLKWG